MKMLPSCLLLMCLVAVFASPAPVTHGSFPPNIAQNIYPNSTQNNAADEVKARAFGVFLQHSALSAKELVQLAGVSKWLKDWIVHNDNWKFVETLASALECDRFASQLYYKPSPSTGKYQLQYLLKKGSHAFHNTTLRFGDKFWQNPRLQRNALDDYFSFLYYRQDNLFHHGRWQREVACLDRVLGVVDDVAIVVDDVKDGPGIDWRLILTQEAFWRIKILRQSSHPRSLDTVRMNFLFEAIRSNRTNVIHRWLARNDTPIEWMHFVAAVGTQNEPLLHRLINTFQNITLLKSKITYNPSSMDTRDILTYAFTIFEPSQETIDRLLDIIPLSRQHFLVAAAYGRVNVLRYFTTVAQTRGFTQYQLRNILRASAEEAVTENFMLRFNVGTPQCQIDVLDLLVYEMGVQIPVSLKINTVLCALHLRSGAAQRYFDMGLNEFIPLILRRISSEKLPFFLNLEGVRITRDHVLHLLETDYLWGVTSMNLKWIIEHLPWERGDLEVFLQHTRIGYHNSLIKVIENLLKEHIHDRQGRTHKRIKFE